MVDPVIRFIKALRREEATLSFAILLLWVEHSFSNWLTPELAKFLEPWWVVLRVQGVLYLAGFACLAYGGFRNWRLVYVTDLPPAKDRPSAIKGPMAFTEGVETHSWRQGGISLLGGRADGAGERAFACNSRKVARGFGQARHARRTATRTPDSGALPTNGQAAGRSGSGQIEIRECFSSLAEK